MDPRAAACRWRTVLTPILLVRWDRNPEAPTARVLALMGVPFGIAAPPPANDP